MKAQSKIIAAFPYSGMEKMASELEKETSVSILRLNAFLVYRRAYTEEEKQKWITEWNENHLMDGEVAFHRLHGDDSKIDVHEDYKERFIEAVQKELDIQTNIIFVEACAETIHLLLDSGYTVDVIYPDKSLYETWIGRIAIENSQNGYNHYTWILDKYIENWYSIIHTMDTIESNSLIRHYLTNQNSIITKELINEILDN